VRKSIEKLLNAGFPAYKLEPCIPGYAYTANDSNVWETTIVYPAQAEELTEGHDYQMRGHERYYDLGDGDYMYWAHEESIWQNANICLEYDLAGVTLWALQNGGHEIPDLGADMSDDEDCATCRFREAGHAFIDAWADMLCD
jgi:hypothetical protein